MKKLNNLHMRNLATILCLLLIPLWCYTQSGTCEDCRRTATLDNSTVNDPMGIVNPEAFPYSIFTRLAEMMTQPCFHFTTKAFIEEEMRKAQDDGIDVSDWLTDYREPEYSFDADFVSGLDEYNDEGRPVRSKLTISMYFNGEQREFVHRWQTLGTWEISNNSGTSWSGHGNKLRSAYENGPDTEEIIERFEKRPLNCTISPEKEEVAMGESIEVKIDDFKDLFALDSREFNRIIVHALHGKIRNGENCDIGPDYKVFLVKDGTITVQYNAPDDCEAVKDRITVYNSCDVLPEAKTPLQTTSMDERIAEKEIKINCFDALLTITKRSNREIRTSEHEKRPDGSCTNETRKSHDLQETIDATIKISLKVERSADMPLYNQRWVYYSPVTVSITKFDLTSSERQYSYGSLTGGNCENSGFETILSRKKILQNSRIAGNPPVEMTKWIVAYDAKTNKALKIIPGGYVVNYDLSEEESLQSKKWPEDRSNPSYTKNRILNNLSFGVGPVEDAVPDPAGNIKPDWMTEYLKDKVGEKKATQIPIILPMPEQTAESAKIQPDVLVKSGNGITQFGGEGRKTNEKQLKGGSEREDLVYTWNMKLTTKK